MWIPQLEYEEQKCQRLRAQAQHEHEHHEMLRKARERAMDAREKATKRNIQRANDESSKDQLEAEWNRIKLMQISDDPWAETRWATFLNLTDARDCDPEWERWYSAHDEPTPLIIHPEQAARLERKANQARCNADIEEVLSIARATPPTLGCENNPSTTCETRQTLNTTYATKWQFHAKPAKSPNSSESTSRTPRITTSSRHWYNPKHASYNSKTNSTLSATWPKKLRIARQYT